ncbi:7302_t:CDS:2 [Funneliformis mosseae]|uniref:Nucleolar protein 58 n=1 Tax=Funneliformis mosseae TaxID=27381 RepID=A0A9N9H398_FUNMO|nr:7302_t:CDS:2 [Funneliformis mosseae]
MLVLFETAAGYALFKVLNEDKLEEPNELWKEVKLVNFQKFENMNEAVISVSDLLEGKLSKDLKNFLKESFDNMELSSEQLAVIDPKIGTTISKKFGIQVVSDKIIMELYRGIKQQLDALMTGIKADDINQMVLGLSHSLSRHKLKFSPDKVDNMIIQAIGLLDDLDKELNTYAMRVKEWYGWHFPEMSKIVVDNLAYAKIIKAMGFRTNAQTTDLSEILPEDLEKELKEAAEISMGSEIAREDIDNIVMGCEQIISLTEYRAELYEYLKNRMLAIAPNLTTLVGELVGARLIAHSGSLLNLAKHPASTVQILGAEKALFRALKTKNPTPKYGLIYHASLVGQASPKNKGKVARILATKSSLATRFDALSEDKDIQAEMGHSNRKYVESRIRSLEGRNGAGTSQSVGTSTAGIKRKAEEMAATEEESDEDSTEEESEQHDSTKSIKSKDKNKKAKKQIKVSAGGTKHKAKEIVSTDEEESEVESADESSTEEESDQDDSIKFDKSKDKIKKEKKQGQSAGTSTAGTERKIKEESQSAKASTSGTKRKAEETDEEESEQDSTDEESVKTESKKSKDKSKKLKKHKKEVKQEKKQPSKVKDSKEEKKDKSKKSKDKDKKAKKQKKEDEQEKKQPSKEVKGKSKDDKKKDKKEKKKEKSSKKKEL